MSKRTSLHTLLENDPDNNLTSTVFILQIWHETRPRFECCKHYWIIQTADVFPEKKSF